MEKEPKVERHPIIDPPSLNPPFPPVLTINIVLALRSPQQDTIISNFIQNIYDTPTYFGENHAIYDLEIVGTKEPLWYKLCPMEKIEETTKTIESSPNIKLKFSGHLTPKQERKLIQILIKYQTMFAWSYPDMKGVIPTIFQHHI